MSSFEKFITESNKNADELAKAEAMLMLGEGLMAQARAKNGPAEERRRKIGLRG